MAKKTTKRGLSLAEMKSERSKRQAYVSCLDKLKSNEKVAPEVRAIIKKMHKAALVVVSLGNQLSIENSKYLK